jgi:hypothetical protein
MSSNKVENLYYRLNKKIKKNYSFLDQEFKDVKNLFELQFRLLELDRKNAANANLKKITKKNIIHKNFYRIIIIIYSNLFNFFNKTPRIFMRSKSMSKLAEKKLWIVLRYQKIKTLGTASIGDGWIEKIRYMYLNTWIYDILELASEVNYVLKNYKCENIEKLARLVKTDIFIMEINAAFKSDKNFISKVLKNFCIKGVLLHTDQTPSGYTLVQAANEINIKTAVLAHGTITDPCLASVLPIHAKKIFVWTRETEKYINFCNKSRVAELASGIKTGIIVRKKANSILIAGDPYNFINKNLEIRFENFIEKLRKRINSLELLYCPHPTDRNKITKKKIINLGIEWSEISTYRAAENAKIVIGGVSSFLFESYCSGIPTFQLKEFLFNYKEYKEFKSLPDHWVMDKLPQLTYKEFLNNYENIIKGSLNVDNLKFDVKPFVNFYKSKKFKHV